MSRRIVVLLFVGVLTALVADANQSNLAAAARASGRQPLEARPGPPPSLRTVKWFNSEAMTLEQLRGRVVLLDFWATWCRPCVAAHPKLRSLADALRDQPFTAILVHSRSTRQKVGATMHNPPAEAVLPQFLRDRGWTLPVAVAERGVFEEFGVRGIPHYVLIDKRGVIRYSRPGRMPDVKEIAKLLAE